MKALVYNGPKDVSISAVPDAKIERPTDVVIKITSTNICGFRGSGGSPIRISTAPSDQM